MRIASGFNHTNNATNSLGAGDVGAVGCNSQNVEFARFVTSDLTAPTENLNVEGQLGTLFPLLANHSFRGIQFVFNGNAWNSIIFSNALFTCNIKQRGRTFPCLVVYCLLGCIGV